jgi:hypothetical protein
MKRKQLPRGWLFLIPLLAAAGFIIFPSYPASTKKSAVPANGNPQQFHLWATSNSISFTFNCDPRATDEWLFRTGGGMMIAGNPGITNILTNGWSADGTNAAPAYSGYRFKN